MRKCEDEIVAEPLDLRIGESDIGRIGFEIGKYDLFFRFQRLEPFDRYIGRPWDDRTGSFGYGRVRFRFDDVLIERSGRRRFGRPILRVLDRAVGNEVFKVRRGLPVLRRCIRRRPEKDLKPRAQR